MNGSSGPARGGPWEHLKAMWDILLTDAEGSTRTDNRPLVDSVPKRFPMAKVAWVEGQHGLNRQTQ